MVALTGASKFSSGNPIDVATGGGLALGSIGAGAMLMGKGRSMPSIGGYAASARSASKLSRAFSSAATRRYGAAGAVGAAGIGFVGSGLRDLKQGEFNKSKGKLAMVGATGVAAYGLTKKRNGNVKKSRHDQRGGRTFCKGGKSKKRWFSSWRVGCGCWCAVT